MAVGEIAAFVNGNLGESLDKLIKRMFSSAFGNSSLVKVEVKQFSKYDPLPLTLETDKQSFVVLQEQIDNMTYITRGDTLITTVEPKGKCLITADIVRPFDGRFVYVGGEAVKVIPFTKGRGVPLLFTHEETGQNQWVGMPQVEELTENGYVTRNEPVKLHANGDISVDVVRAFDGRLIFLGGA